ncbi:hypothetical protein LXA43DRAFT_977145 [Ganoderma leucocontextum]|nr:hypothetical protein LXA43DRAFT_977145 [Ganoderma leucocontextum]
MATTIDYVGLPDVLACGWCGRTDVCKQQLKQCGGCGAIRYCSKDCQKQACMEWANIHEDAFSTIIHAIVRSNGGADWVLNNDRSMVFYLRPLKRVFDNPATALEITSLSLMSEDVEHGDSEPFRDHWEGPLKTSDRYMPLSVRGPDPRAFIVADTEVAVHSHYVLYRPENHAHDAPVDKRVAGAFADISRLCVRTVGVGLVLRDPPLSTSPFPQTGYMVREKKKKKKKWMWKPMRDPAGLMAITMDADDRPRRSSLSLQELWALWRQW